MIEINVIKKLFKTNAKLDYWDDKWSIRPTDCFGRDIAIGDKVAFTLTNYQDRFKKMCKGTIVGFTECFIKIKPDEQYINKYQEKEYILRKYNRVIKL